MEETRLLFGERLSEPGSPQAAPARSRCPGCGRRFAATSRFCPFDGDRLSSAADWKPAADPLLGQIVAERYEVEAVIGEGGMGTVYRVEHVVLKKRFALKALRLELAGDPEVLARFSEEARTTTRLSHPGIVEVLDYGTLPSGRAYFVMELLEGSSLREILRVAGRLPPPRVAHIARGVAEALSAAHAVNVVHRDLKPDNVHLLPDDRVKVVDFGLARVVGQRRVTREGVVFGTPHYMSPEQACGSALDQRSDIYGLGVLLYEALTGSVPFDAESYVEIVEQHLNVAPTPPGERLGTPGVFGALEDIVLRCLAKKADDRFASLTELLGALDSAASSVAEGPRVALPEAVPEPAAPAEVSAGLPVVPLVPRRRGPWLLAACAAGLAALGLAGTLPRTQPSAAPAAAVPAPPASHAPAASPTPTAGAPTTPAAAPAAVPVASPRPSPAAGRGARPREAGKGGAATPERRLSARPRGDVIDPWHR